MRIMQSYRRKIRRKFPKSEINQEGLLGCKVSEFADYLQKNFKAGMNWDNYGESWVVANVGKPFSTESKAAIAKHFSHKSYRPIFREELGTNLSIMIGREGEGKPILVDKNGKNLIAGDAK